MTKKFGGHLEKQTADSTENSYLNKLNKPCKEYQETYYWKILFERNTKSLIPMNKFWASLLFIY